MSRIQDLVRRKKGNMLSIFLPAAYPTKDHTVPLIQALIKEGVDKIELGMPFSDPILDGPVIQEANLVAIRQGFTLSYLFTVISQVREFSEAPLVLMGSVNPILRHGFDKFCEQSAMAGADGLLLPDLPLEEYQGVYQSIVDSYNLSYIFLVSSQTSSERVRLFDSIGTGFLYLVALAGVTGGTFKVDTGRHDYLQRMKEMNLKNPLFVGFGIDSPEKLKEVWQYAEGGIIGSAFLRAIHPSKGDSVENARRFIAHIKDTP